MSITRLLHIEWCPLINTNSLLTMPSRAIGWVFLHLFKLFEKFFVPVSEVAFCARFKLNESGTMPFGVLYKLYMYDFGMI